ncbi:hypothetical protein Tco_0335687 [Tanacetum coccineum]
MALSKRLGKTLFRRIEDVLRMRWRSGNGFEDLGGASMVSSRKGGEDYGLDLNEEEIVPKVEDVSLVDGVFDDAFGEEGDEDFVIGEGVVVSSSLLVRSIKSCLGGMMVSFIFFEGLEGEASVEAMEVKEK